MDQHLSTLPIPTHTSPKRKKDPFAASPSMAPDTQATLNYQDHVTNQLHMSLNLYDFMIALPPIAYILGLLPNKQIDTKPTTIRMIYSENLHRSSSYMQHYYYLEQQPTAPYNTATLQLHLQYPPLYAKDLQKPP